VNDDELLQLLHDTATAIAAALDGISDWGLTGTREGQHHSDLLADEAALAVLSRAGVGVLSEESGMRAPERDVMVVVDPLDGSTNAHRGVPWYATSLCAVDGDGPRAALVANLVSSQRFTALRGAGARCDGEPVRPTACASLDAAVVGVSGRPRHDVGWHQFRALGAIALDLCAVASGALDGFVDCDADAHGPWDYLGGALVCHEAGAPVVDAAGRDLVALSHDARRTPVAAATPALLDQLLQARVGWELGEPADASPG
jgi:fructose-1,6-bisphosphatase/inositol monophosphatase family enzyme